MIIGTVSENKDLEKRISITPEIAKKYISNGFEVMIEKDLASHLGISDKEFLKEGCKIETRENVLNQSNIILQLNLPDEKSTSLLKEGKILIGNFNSSSNKEVIANISNKKINVFSMELLPRITRAQSMDILSSQANLAGYKAVVDSFAMFKKAIPMMMTAAGTISAAKVLVVGAGVAGLQAIATAKRMGAIVFATDVRLASKEQVESLGGKFLVVEGAENLETEGGYAMEASEEFKKKQEELLAETLKTGSVIYDLAASQGGNAAFTEADKIIEKHGVTIVGESTILNKLPTSASNLYAKNLFNFVLNLYNKDKKKIDINLEDEIVSKTLVK